MVIDFEYKVNDEWYEGVYKDKNEPCSAARPFSLKHSPKSDKAVLCIHGYTGYPGEVTRPAVDLYEAGFDVYAPRLPGHGTTGEDFINIKYEDIVSVVLKAAEDLCASYGTVHVFGHSMGGGLALITASHVKGIKSVAVAGPAASENKSKLPVNPLLMKLLGAFKKRMPNKWAPDPEYIMYYEGAPKDDLYLGKEYWSWLYPRQLTMLFKVMLEAGKALDDIDRDILTISGGKDSIIGDGSSLLIMEKGKGRNRHLHLDNATHYMFYDKDKSEEQRAVESVLDWFCAHNGAV